MPRNRSRAGAGKSEASHKKLDYFKKLATGQVAAYRIKRHSNSVIAIVDLNAGDGEGVARLQLDLFNSNLSMPTPALAMKLATPKDRVILCDKNLIKAEALKIKFPSAIVVRQHADVLEHLTGVDYALVLSDPCGPAGHGMPYLEQIARSVRSDFIIAVNVGAIARINGTEKVFDGPQVKSCNTMRERYSLMGDLESWRKRLGRQQISATRVTRASNGFRYRMIVVADFLSDAAKRKPFEVLHETSSRDSTRSHRPSPTEPTPHSA